MSHQYSKKSTPWLQQLQATGLRMTRQRKVLFEVVFSLDRPSTADDIIEKIKQIGHSVHRATIYRDLLILVQKDLLRQISLLGESRSYYELVTEQHHHHFLCQVCHTIQDVFPTQVEHAIAQFEKEFSFSGHSISTHHLKFYGVRNDCQKLAPQPRLSNEIHSVKTR